MLPAWFLRRAVINYIVANSPAPTHLVTCLPDRIPARVEVTPGDRVATTFPHDQYAASHAQTVSPGSVLPRSLIEEQFRKIARWPFVYKYSVLPIIHYFDMRSRLNSLTMPVLLINRANDALAPEEKTRWLAEHLPNCAGYHVVAGGERFFMYSQAETVNALIEEFLTLRTIRADN